MSYKVKLEVFEGPLDLLLYLIKRDELEIYDIPIARITEEYLAYLNLMKLLDLDVAGEFLVMSATLMHIKSHMLLPQEAPLEDMAEELDPRAELIQRLLEYQKFKEAARTLGEREEEHRRVFARGGTLERPPDEGEGKQQFFEANLFDLISAFSRALDNVPRELFYEIIKDEVTVEDKMHDIIHWLLDNDSALLSELFITARSKIEIIATFLAVLELIRLKEIIAYQDENFGDIKLERNLNGIEKNC